MEINYIEVGKSTQIFLGSGDILVCEDNVDNGKMMYFMFATSRIGVINDSPVLIRLGEDVQIECTWEIPEVSIGDIISDYYKVIDVVKSRDTSINLR